MLVKDFVAYLNEKGRTIEQYRFKSLQDYKSHILEFLDKCISDLNLEDCIFKNSSELRFLTRIEEKNHIGSVGEKLIEINSSIKRDKRFKYDYVGTLNSIEFSLHDSVDKCILDYEIEDLFDYFEIKELKSSIEYYKSEIIKTEDYLASLKEKLDIAVKELDNMEAN